MGFLCNLRKNTHNVLKKAAMQLHIGEQNGTSPSRIEGFRKFEADLTVLIYPDAGPVFHQRIRYGQYFAKKHSHFA